MISRRMEEEEEEGHVTAVRSVATVSSSFFSSPFPSFFLFLSRARFLIM